MSLIVPWLVFPLLLALLALGCGLLVETVAGRRLPAALVPPVGLATLIVAADFTTAWAASASLTVPLVVVLAVAGLGLSDRWRECHFDAWVVLTAVATYTVFSAPVVLSGQATFAGYIKLDDTATFLGFIDRAMQHGHSAAGLSPSSYQAVLTFSGSYPHYPFGAFLPLGIGSRLVATDPAWLYQPCIAFFAAMLALSLSSVLTPLVGSRPLRALAAFVAAQAALLYGYALWGGIKELGAAVVIATAAALAPTGAEELRSLRRLIPFTLSCAATLAVLNVSAGFWLLPLGLPVLVVVAGQRERRLLFSLLAGSGLIAVLSLPTLVIARGFLKFANSSLLLPSERLGNLVRPLNMLQIFGVWPTGDFRFWPGERGVTEILVAVTALAAAAALAVALRRRIWRLPLLVVSVGVAALLLDWTSSPWLAGKSYAIASPALVLAALAAAAMLAESRFRIEGAVLALLVAGGVFWSVALAYHDVWLAPRAQLQELERIGDRFAGQGPALMTEFQPYGVRHFLRRLDAEGASELRVRPVFLSDGTVLGGTGFADLDRFAMSSLLVYRTLVLRSSPVESRPPAPYALVWRGRYYEVWQRSELAASQVLEHLGLGDAQHVAAVPSCSDVLRLGGAAARAGGRIVAAPRRNGVLLPLAQAAFPAGWQPDSTGQLLLPKSAGTLTGSIAAPEHGSYTVYLGGSFARTVTISIDGRRVGSLRMVLTEASQWTPFGSLELRAGIHTLTLRYGGSRFAPGSGAGPFPLGPLALSLEQPDDLVSVSPAGARSLCGKSLDWVEAVGP